MSFEICPPILLQVSDAEATSKWQLVKGFLALFEFEKNSTEPEALGAKLDCAKAGIAALKDRQALMHAYENQEGNDKELMACLAASIRSWQHYRQIVASSAGKPVSELVQANADFTSLMTRDDPDIMNIFGFAAQQIRADVITACEDVTGLMEVGASWKGSAERGTVSIEDLIQEAEPTLMQVKGKKLTAHKDLLEKAWLLS